MYDIFDSIIISLSKITGLLKETEPEEHQPTRGDDQAQRVDPWTVDFGSNFKGQVATVLMFSLVNEHGNLLRKGWNHVCFCQILIRLDHGLCAEFVCAFTSSSSDATGPRLCP